MRGTVKFYGPKRGFGFIVSDNGDDRDIFVHEKYLVLEAYLTSGDKVEFEIQETPKGPIAVNVRKVK